MFWLILGATIFLSACQDWQRLPQLLARCDGTTDQDITLPPKTQAWEISPDQHWIIYTEPSNDPRDDWRKRHWLAKLECGKPVNPVLFFEPQTNIDGLLGFSSDSSALLYESEMPDYTMAQLWLVPLPNFQDKRMIYAVDMIRSWEWSPDRMHLLVTPGDQGADWISADGIVERIIPEDTFQTKSGGVISWSPKGDQFVYAEIVGIWDRPINVWITDVMTKERKLLFTSHSDHASLNANWSPNGETIALIGSDGLKSDG